MEDVIHIGLACTRCGDPDCPFKKGSTPGVALFKDHNRCTCIATCRAGFLCTRPYKHEGKHEAVGPNNEQWAIWGDDAEEVLNANMPTL